MDSEYPDQIYSWLRGHLEQANQTHGGFARRELGLPAEMGTGNVQGFGGSTSSINNEMTVRRFSQLVLFSGIVAICLFKWAMPELVPQNRIPFLPADIDRARAEEKERKAVQSEARAAREVFVRFGCGWEDLSLLTARYSHAHRLPAKIVAAQIVAESSCRPDVVSSAGAVGLMQIRDSVWRTGENLRDPETNVRVGTSILARYVKQYGLKEGLHAYNGFGDPSDTYSSKILNIARSER